MGDRRHLVIGASGQVGHALLRGLHEAGDQVLGTYLTHPEDGLVHLDMRDIGAIHHLIESYAPDVVWIPGAMPDVDRCQKEPDFSYAVNVQGPTQVLEVVASRHLPLIYFSTDYVFDGTDGPYQEGDRTHPLQVYGEHKVAAEERLMRYEDTLVIRPAWIYSDEPNPRNFIFRVLSDLKASRPIRSAEDQINTPTPAAPLAREALAALNAGHRGILHLVGPERMTRLQLVQSIAAMAGYDDRLIEPIHVSELPLPAPRPLNGGLVTHFLDFAIRERLQDIDITPLLTKI